MRGGGRNLPKTAILFAAIVAILALSQTTTAATQLVSFQGRILQSGSPATSGNIAVTIWSASDGGSVIYSDNFANAINDGFFDLMLGSSSELNLTYGNFYYLDMSINGQDINWTSPAGATVNRIQFQSQNGQISTGMIQVNAVNTTIIQNDAITSAKIAPAAVNSSHLNSAGTYYIGGLGIGTTSPSAKLEVNYNTSTGLAMNISNVLFVNATTGGVGIGTTGPNYKLDVSGQERLNLAPASSNQDQLILYSPSGYGSYQNYHRNLVWNDGITNVGGIGLSYDGTKLNLDIHSLFNSGYKTDSDIVMRIQGNGNVGIGTTSPAEKLDVTAGNIKIGDTYTTSQLKIGSFGHYIGRDSSDGSLRIGGGQATILLLNSVGIGTTPTYQFQLSLDSAAKPGTNTWTIASDARIKTDIRPFNDSLSVIEKIDPVWYKYNGLGGFVADGKDQIGVIGQDIQKAAPYTVNTYKAKLNPDDQNETELLNFNSHALTFVLINSVKELKAENDQLKARLAALEARG